MRIRPLIIGPDERARIAEVRAFAAENVVDIHAANAAAESDIEAYRDMMIMHSFELPRGYAITYTHEHHRAGLACHISVSVNQRHAMPGVPAVEMILEEFGMMPLAQSIHVWIEKDETEPGHAAVNILQMVPS